MQNQPNLMVYGLKYMKKAKNCLIIVKNIIREELISSLFPCFFPKAYFFHPRGRGALLAKIFTLGWILTKVLGTRTKLRSYTLYDLMHISHTRSKNSFLSKFEKVQKSMKNARFWSGFLHVIHKLIPKQDPIGKYRYPTHRGKFRAL